jgi:hypothetical protein
MTGFAFLNIDDKPIVFIPEDIIEYTEGNTVGRNTIEIRKML